MKKKLNGVFEGGGVKGTGLVGAIAVGEELGYEFVHVAGTSAGAIVAAFVAAGYKAKEMKEILDGLDYLKFKDKGPEDYIPMVGSLVSLFLTKGIYEGDFFEQWIRKLLEAKNIHTFSDLVIPEHQGDLRYRYKLSVIVSDITKGNLVILPEDIADYGWDPDELNVARAVRMSMSLPFFYRPVVLKDRKGTPHYIVDGGILSNFPVWIYDDDEYGSPWPTLGYKLVEPEARPHAIRGPVTLFAALFSTMMEAHDARYIKDANFMRTIPIPTLGIQTTEFEITKERKEALYQSGVNAAKEFFEKWNFERYKVEIQKKEVEGRRERIWKV
ncbi:MAG: patatin-like phospholipase family protein [Patescibacteria group bacterium]